MNNELFLLDCVLLKVCHTYRGKIPTLAKHLAKDNCIKIKITIYYIFSSCLILEI